MRTGRDFLSFVFVLQMYVAAVRDLSDRPLVQVRPSLISKQSCRAVHRLFLDAPWDLQHSDAPLSKAQQQYNDGAENEGKGRTSARGG
jgi:hypothetical protein